MDVVVGRLQMHPAGYGFVVADDDKAGKDLYIAPTNIKEALHGDRVIARLEHQRGDRAEGRIIRILERANSTLVGRFDVDDSGLGFVVPFDRRVLADIQIPRGESRHAKSGQMVVTELTRWPTPTRPPLGRVIEVLGGIDDPGVDTRNHHPQARAPGRARRRGRRRGAPAGRRRCVRATSRVAPISAS